MLNVDKIREEEGNEITGNHEPVNGATKSGNAPEIEWGSERYPPSWDMEEDKTIEGFIREFGEVQIGGRDAIFVNVMTKSKTVTVWMGIVIKDRLAALSAEVGDYLGIRYLGKVISNSGKEYRDFDVRVMKQQSISDFEGAGKDI